MKRSYGRKRETPFVTNARYVMDCMSNAPEVCERRRDIKDDNFQGGKTDD